MLGLSIHSVSGNFSHAMLSGHLKPNFSNTGRHPLLTREQRPLQGGGGESRDEHRGVYMEHRKNAKSAEQFISTSGEN